MIFFDNPQSRQNDEKMKDIANNQKHIGKEQGGGITPQHDFAVAQKGMISHPTFGGGKGFGERKPGKVLVRKLFTGPAAATSDTY